MTETFLNIAAVERDTGVSRHVLRMWERRYGFPKPIRDGAAERQYPADQVERLRLIRRLIELDHRPGKVVPLPLEDLERMVSQADNRPSAVSAAEDVGEYLRVAATGGLVELRRRLQGTLVRNGLERFVLDTLRPLTAAIGEACSVDDIRPGEAHLYADQLHRVLREALAPLQGVETPRMLLTALAPERHELGLLMLEALFRIDGADCISVGVGLTPSAVAELATEADADVVALSFSEAYQGDASTALAQLRATLPPRVEIWCGGAGVRAAGRRRTGMWIVPTLEDGVRALRRWRKVRAGASASVEQARQMDIDTDEIVASPAAFNRAIEVPIQRELFAHWLASRNGAAVPRPRDIDLAKVPHLAPSTGLIEVLQPGPRFRYQTLGSELAGSFAQSVAGRTVRAAKAGAYARFLESVYATALGLGGPIISSGISHYRNAIQRRFHRVVLPLSSDGARIDKLLYSTVGFAMHRDDPHPLADDILRCDGRILGLPGSALIKVSNPG